MDASRDNRKREQLRVRKDLDGSEAEPDAKRDQSDGCGASFSEPAREELIRSCTLSPVKMIRLALAQAESRLAIASEAIEAAHKAGAETLLCFVFPPHPELEGALGKGFARIQLRAGVALPGNEVVEVVRVVGPDAWECLRHAAGQHDGGPEMRSLAQDLILLERSCPRSLYGQYVPSKEEQDLLQRSALQSVARSALQHVLERLTPAVSSLTLAWCHPEAIGNVELLAGRNRLMRSLTRDTQALDSMIESLLQDMREEEETL